MWSFLTIILSLHCQYSELFGGRLTSYESIVERARREAIVRLKLEAEKMGANHIMGLRLSTTELGMQGGMVEVLATERRFRNNFIPLSYKVMLLILQKRRSIICFHVGEI